MASRAALEAAVASHRYGEQIFPRRINKVSNRKQLIQQRGLKSAYARRTVGNRWSIAIYSPGLSDGIVEVSGFSAKKKKKKKKKPGTLNFCTQGTPPQRRAESYCPACWIRNLSAYDLRLGLTVCVTCEVQRQASTDQVYRVTTKTSWRFHASLVIIITHLSCHCTLLAGHSMVTPPKLPPPPPPRPFLSRLGR